jgi:LytTr DNA-binding domain
VTAGGAAGAEAATAVTSGGVTSASGARGEGWRRPPWLTALSFAGVGLIQMIVNATSRIDERRALGRPVDMWQPWAWESTSFVVWLALLPLILWLAERIADRVSALSGRIALHLLATIAFSLVHSAGIWGLRLLVYQLAGERYTLAGPLADTLLYEYRKDAVTYAVILMAYFLIKRLVAPAPSVAIPNPPSDVRIEVRDGNRIFLLKADDIEWVAAAGNYVELHGAFGTHLARRTLAEILGELTAHGFVQIHRSRLVQRTMVAKIETRQSGDFDVTLRGGSVIGGSRRYRSNL